MTSELVQAPDALESLRSFLDSAPSPYHAVTAAEKKLLAAGFTRCELADPDWRAGDQRRFVAVGGLLIAWVFPSDARPARGWRMVGAHTDSPNLRIKPKPDLARAGFAQLGVEVYGGALVNSWLDRDLGLSGRVQVRVGDQVVARLFRVDEPTLRVAQLAIHLDRDVNERGLQLDRQLHLAPVWGTTSPPLGFRGWLASEVNCDPGDVLAFDVMTHDIAGSALLGQDQSLLASGRLDNLVSSWAAVESLIEVADGLEAGGAPAAIALYDHEEVGSQSSTGAASTALATVIERTVLAVGGGRSDYLAAVASSVLASADMAHAAHPNYLDRVEPEHVVVVNGGPALKINANARYATDAPSAAVLWEAAARAGIELQTFVTRSNIPCGSTIGPAVATQLGVATVDVGAPMLSMHSARELMGVADIEPYQRLLAAFLLAAE